MSQPDAKSPPSLNDLILYTLAQFNELKNEIKELDCEIITASGLSSLTPDRVVTIRTNLLCIIDSAFTIRQALRFVEKISSIQSLAANTKFYEVKYLVMNIFDMVHDKLLTREYFNLPATHKQSSLSFIRGEIANLVSREIARVEAESHKARSGRRSLVRF